MRKNDLVKFSSDGVQGEGSFVTMCKPRWQALRAAMADFRQGDELDAAAQEALGMKMLETLIPQMVVAWNWTDEEGNELPLPKSDDAVLAEMPVDEAMFLVACAGTLMPAPRKN